MRRTIDRFFLIFFYFSSFFANAYVERAVDAVMFLYRNGYVSFIPLFFLCLKMLYGYRRKEMMMIFSIGLYDFP